MAKNTYIGSSNNTASKVKRMYIGVDGVARRVIKGYIGVNGVARQFYGINKNPNFTFVQSPINAGNSPPTDIIWSTQHNLYVLVGGYTCRSSPDGISWTARGGTAFNGAGNLRFIRWFPAISAYVFFVTGDIGGGPSTSIYISTNLDAVSSPTINIRDYRLSDVIVVPEKNQLVALSTGRSGYPGSSILLSSNGADWTDVTGMMADPELKSICWSSYHGKYLGFTTVYTPGGLRYVSPVVRTSVNGASWTSNELPLPAGMRHAYFNSVCWAPELSLYVAVGGADTTSSNSPSNRVLFGRSANGTSWTYEAVDILPGMKCTLTKVTYIPELQMFVATGMTHNSTSTSIYGYGFMCSSVDGYNWTVHLANDPQVPVINGVGWSPKLNRIVMGGPPARNLYGTVMSNNLVLANF